MSQDNTISQTTSKAVVDDLQGLEIDTFRVEELDQLDVDASSVNVSICSSTTSSTCCG